MKIDITNKSPYRAVIDKIRELTTEDGCELITQFIVRIKTTILGESNELLLYDNNNEYYFDSDWYEGGEVELLWFVDIEDIDMEKTKRLQRDLEWARNDLCLKCGSYNEAHLGACDGCRYRHGGEWSADLDE